MKSERVLPCCRTQSSTAFSNSSDKLIRTLIFSSRAQRLDILLVPHQALSDPTGVATTIKNGKNHNRIFDAVVVDRKWKPLGQLAVVAKNHGVNAAEVGQRIDVRIEAIEKI
jgi:hypothetical protein